MGWIIYLKTVKYHLYGQVLYILCCFEPSIYHFCVVDLLFIKAVLSIKQVKRITKWVDNTKFDTKLTVQAVYSEVKPKKEFSPPHPGFFR